MHLSDRVTGLCLALLGSLAFWGGSRLPAVPGQDVGPAAFPMVIGTGLVLCGLMIAFGIGHTFEVEEPAEREEAPGLAKLLGGLDWLAAFLPPVLLLFYVVAADRLGFLITAAIMLLVASRALGASWRLAIGVTVLAPPFVHLVFYKLLRVPLPDGPLTMPW
ncbi:tripartite tricarboxylate transporter TctB family protein [Roseomonas sp. HJA6]|uniref:Tripartite tricarboxylate transporter TctB family protein n=1 Tax=Roseomonas alba TaxID=2846776 RepID=A0ABS7A9S8_9PROT|nr:tripartite tricarboxylate transporter TctB family protein [Neoroseomonas alba]MBW6399057.1 tripartite tricarboxylate transporter TctB family protein [Neoroseomonas alba]